MPNLPAGFPPWLIRGGSRWKELLRERRHRLKNPLDSLWGTVISGFVLTGILFFVVRALVNA